MDIEHWKRKGFAFEARFPNEYDLWINRETMQNLRRYVGGREWLSNLTTGEYELVQDMRQTTMNDQTFSMRGEACIVCPPKESR